MTVSAMSAAALPTTMVAAQLVTRGGADRIVVQRAALPRLADDDALVAVHAAAITPSELAWEPTWVNSDGTDRTPTVPGHEIAGTVAAVDSQTTGLVVGSKVFGLTDFYRDGGAAEYIAVRADLLAEWPTAVDAEKAAALPLSGLTAWQALFDHGHLLTGQRVLIHGAAGAVGTFAVQLAHLEGAHVTAIAAAREADFVRDLGADVVIDLAAGRGAIAWPSMDVIVDTLGGDVIDRSWPLLAGDGRLVSSAPSSRGIEDVDPRGRFFIVTPDRGVLDELVGLVESGQLRVVVERTFPLDRTREAYEFAQRGHPHGKVVLRLRPSSPETRRESGAPPRGIHSWQIDRPDQQQRIVLIHAPAWLGDR